ncbi:ornithine--oxo-acid transaminase [Pseudonocardia dioxanivorans]|uniref:ornithine--oxo-acid transaminase n=1 Tax=Pseudonocardia dioxanivorans TaxID=240495 RepID=UPI000CCFEE67
MTLTDPLAATTTWHEQLLAERSAHNYAPLPVVLTSGSGARVVDVEGREYIDCLAGYSALNFGHGHPALVAAAHRQLDRLTLTGRAFGNDQLGPFCAELAALVGKQMVLPMNTGAEAVESGLKVARKWGYEVRGVPHDRARVVVAANNFHGRTIGIVGFSTDPEARNGFGPFAPGFDVVPYGDADALRAAVGPETVAVLVEPVQGEAGVVVPPPGYLAAVRDICTDAGILFVADEVQSGFGRTGHVLATRGLGGVDADVYLLGKALGGGILPVSAVVADEAVLGVLRPGQHGSTFGGNPLACAVGRAAVGLMAEPALLRQVVTLGEILRTELEALVGRGVVTFRSVGLWAGVDIDPALGTGRTVCEALCTRGVLAKETHGATVRLSPPLVIAEADLRHALATLGEVLAGLAG